MISIGIHLTDVDYDSLVERFLPELFKNVTEDSKLSMKIGNAIVQNKFTNGIAKGIIKIVPKNAKEKMAIDLLIDNKDKIREMLNMMLFDLDIDIHIKNLKVSECNLKGCDGIKIEISLEEIGYSSIVRELLPKVLQSMSEKDDKQGSLGKILLDMKDKPVQMITAALEVLPQEEKDQLVAKIFAVYKDDIVDMINHLIEEQRIAAVISDIGVKAK